VRDRPSRDFGAERRGAVVKAVAAAWEKGCPAAGQDQDAFEETADIAIRRWDGFERRHSKRLGYPGRIEDLAKRTPQSFRTRPQAHRPFDRGLPVPRLPDRRGAVGPHLTSRSDLPLGVHGVLRCLLAERGARGSGNRCWWRTPWPSTREACPAARRAVTDRRFGRDSREPETNAVPGLQRDLSTAARQPLIGSEGAFIGPLECSLGRPRQG
jgi:hypothetical protein